jgi:hypothetical protein
MQKKLVVHWIIPLELVAKYLMKSECIVESSATHIKTCCMQLMVFNAVH